MKKFILFLLFLSSALQLLPALTISINDFNVSSPNPDYEFIGKGISRMIATELKKNKSVNIVEREKMNAVIEEQKLALSGMTDDSMISIGMLLSANYIVMGEIIDMAGQMMFTSRMVDVNTGEVIWSDELIEDLSSYDYISAYFASSLLESLNEETAEETALKMEEKVQKEVETVIYVSMGIDAIDRNDTEQAVQALEKATDIDPENETAVYYLNKLIIGSPKFRIMTEPYFAYQNPAYLGKAEKDSLYLGLGSSILLGGSRERGYTWQEVDDGIYLEEMEMRAFLGYSLPVIKKKLGLGVQAFYSSSSPRTSLDGAFPVGNDWRTYYGGTLTLGYSFDSLSIGAGASLFNESNHWNDNETDEKVQKLSFAAETGLLWDSPASRTVLGTRLGWSNATRTTIDLDTLIEDYHRQVPLFWENSFGYSFKNNKTFLSVLEINDIYLDTGDWLIRLLPVMEHSFTPFFSLRGGLEGSVSGSEEGAQAGFGVISGFTFSFPKRGFDISVNLSFRVRPSKTDYRYLYDELPLTTTFIKDGVFLK